jgi:VWFA-related protein
MRKLCLLMFATLLAGQDEVIRETFKFVLVPVTVVDKNGTFISGLTQYDFRLFDNGKPQKITEDLASHPISMVVAIQANSQVEKILPHIQKLGSVFEGLILGETGELAVLQFDHRVQTLTNFTSDTEQIDGAFRKLKTGSGTSALNDAAMAGINMLKIRPPARRRVMMLIAENRDNGSGIKEREVLMAAEFANVPIYTVDISKLLAALTAKVQPGRPSNLPPGAIYMPNSQVATPTTESQNQLGNWVPLFKDMFDVAKNIFVPNPLTVYTKYTGGREYSFKSQKTLEHDLSQIGEELHSQYLLTYIPNNQSEAGFHQIVVEVAKPELSVRTRDGYWLAGK